MDEQTMMELLKETAAEDRAAWERTGLATASRGWHPSWAELLWHQLGNPAGEEASKVARHLAENGCPSCRARLSVLEAGQAGIVRVLQVLKLFDPKIVYARTSKDNLNVSTRSADHVLESRLVETNDRLVLEARTKEARWQGRLVGYTLHGNEPGAELTGFLVLRPDENDWYAGQVSWDAAEVSRCLGGQIERMLIAPVDEARLTGKEQEVLLASVERSRDEAAAWSAWQAWAEQGVATTAPDSEVYRLYRMVLRRFEG
jgi:hypothetical protein